MDTSHQSFKIKVHPRVIKSIEKLSHSVRFNLFRQLKIVVTEGLTAQTLANLKIHAYPRNTFTIAADSEAVFNSHIEEGCLLRGFYPEDFSQVYYIQQLKCIKDKRCLGVSGRFDENCKSLEKIGEEPTEKYQEITLERIRSELANPFSYFLPKSKNNVLTNSSRNPIMYFRGMFYESLSRLDQVMAVRLHHNEQPMIPAWVVAGDSAYSLHNRAEYKKETIDTLLDKVPEKTLRFINFIDEQDPHSIAHMEYVRLLICTIKRKVYRHLDIENVDIVIRDSEGETPLFRHCKEQFSTQINLNTNGTWPILLVMGDTPRDISQILRAEQSFFIQDKPYIARFHLFETFSFGDMTLEYSDYTSNEDTHYRASLSAATHTLFEIAGMHTDYYSVCTLDLRHKGHTSITSSIVDLCENSIVILTKYPRESRGFKLLVEAAGHMMLHGYPYVTIVIVNENIEGYDTVEIIADIEDFSFYSFTQQEIDQECDDEKLITQIMGTIYQAYHENDALCDLLSTAQTTPLHFAALPCFVHKKHTTVN